MRYQTVKKRLSVFIGLLLLLINLPGLAATSVKIGVLSHRGDANTLKQWSPTADYLTESIEDYQFVIVPLNFEQMDEAVAQGKVDFLLTNPGIYVSMEIRHRISRIATMNNLVDGHKTNQFGGVIFTLSSRNDINDLRDIRGHSMLAVDRISLGGFQMAWREMKLVDLNPYKDTSSLSFAGTHDEVVNGVLEGRSEVGTVRTGILESMAIEGKVDLKQIKVLNPQTSDQLSLLHSSRLYPEWPFSKLKHTSNSLALNVVIALLRMNALEPAAQWGEYAGWTVPLDYQPVHALLKELELPPFENLRRFTIFDVIKRYQSWLMVIGVLILGLLSLTVVIFRLHRRLEESKFLLEQQHLEIINSVADGIYGVDLQGNSTFVNRAMETMTGWSAVELIGKNQHEVLHHTKSDGSPHPADQCPVFKTFMDHQPRFIEEDLFWKKDGSSFPVEYSANPIFDETGQTVGSVVVFRDISEKKKAIEAARQFQLELAHVARLSNMGEMASGLAHELNQPLTAIAANADACVRLLESGADQHRVMDIIERIGKQARHAGEIIRHLREFVRKSSPQQSKVNINVLIKDLILLIRSDIERAGIRLKLELAQKLPEVSMQKVHIDQVMLNLVRNAIEALASQTNDKMLLISSECVDNEKMLIKVSDSGPGLTNEIRDHLFTPFTTSKEQGMGLGLSLSQGIVQAHKGELYLGDSVLGGATFCFTLPVEKT